MKEKWKEWLFLVVASILLPSILTMLISGTRENAGNAGRGISIELISGEMLDMEEFLIYMVAAQIDLEVEEETLKVQSVIARTNLMREVKKAQIAKSDQEKEVQLVKTDQEKQSKFTAADKIEEGIVVKADELNVVYLQPEKFEQSFGEAKREEITKKLKKAVSDTRWMVMTYEGEYIEALYHGVSIGTTISAEESFGQARAYLVSVDSSQDVESEEYMSLTVFTPAQVLAKLQEKGLAKNQTSDTIFSSLKLAQKTKSGYVKKVAIGTEAVSGDEWKEMFHLNSTNFYLEEQDGQLRMIVLGKGHGVGLSQYGADQLSKKGWKWKSILEKYYPGIKITEFE